jgi:hypothetical protein
MSVQRGVFAVGIVASLGFGAVPAYAQQFLLFDVEFTYTWQDAINASPSKSHYYVNDDNVLNTERPSDWLTPIDYRNGTVHIRLEVIDKPPGDQTANWTLCYIANVGEYGCAQTGVYTSEGVYESDVEMTSWWNNETIDWSQGVKQMDLIYKKSTAGLDHIHFFPELEPLLTPTTVRITMVQVAAGDTYDPAATGLDFAAAGGGGSTGSPQAGGTGGAGAGGLGGSAGAGGSGGSDSGLTGGSAGLAGNAGEASAAAGAAGSSGGAVNTETAGVAGSVSAAPVAAAGAAMTEIPQAGSEVTPQNQNPQNQDPESNTDQASSCATQRANAPDCGFASYSLILAALLLRRRKLA